jgi:tetratricopeptide (TPR) repeat protein
VRRIAVVLAAGFALRIAWPLADPEPRFSWSNGVYTDPPTMVHAARSAVLLGSWTADGSRDLWIYPLMNGLTWLFYLPFGPGRLPTVVLAALLGTATVGALAWGLWRAAGPRVAELGAILGALNPWLVFYSRVPVAENVVALLLALSCVAALGRARRSWIAAGALGVAATLFGKYHAVGFLPGLVLFAVLRGRSLRAALPVFVGGTAVFAAWLVAIFLPHSREILGHVERQSTGLHGTLPFLVSPQDGLREILNTLRRSWMFYRMPVEGTLAAFFAIWVAGNGAARRRAVADGSALWAFWFLSVWAYYSLLPYKAPRYFVILAPAIVALAAAALGRLSTTDGIRLRAPAAFDEHLPIAVFLFTFFFGAIDSFKHYATIALEWLTLPPARISQETFQRVTGLFRNLDSFDQTIAWAAGLGIVAYVVVLWNPEILAILRRPRAVLSAGAARGAARALLLLAVASGLWQWGWWAAHRTTFLEEAKSSLPRLVGEDAVLLGPMAPFLAQDSRLRAIPYWGPSGQEDLLAARGVTHVVVCGTGDADELEKRFPGLLAATAVVQVWPVRTLFASTLEVRRTPRELDGRRIHAYEPTLFELGAEDALADRWEAALERFSAWRAEGSAETPELLSLESVCWFRLGDHDRARTLLERVVAERPHDPLHWQSLGVLALEEGDRARALELLMKAWRLDPNNKELEETVRELVR